ncbi:UPF0232 protein [Marmoricola endophyticus]|uniref:UPF0232 protein n=1 Tax=Marmoricola endophyticus TaxID=2040280 RepID=A0A917BLQ6_9ACTN|nr:DciA family protein [Marmoricola endophyticus]GGF47334.1 UPF0232 protein [Marmoricola endophyticus]
MSSEPPADPGPSGHAPDPEEEHRDDGTDLATVIARGLAGRTRAAAPRRRGRGAGAWSADVVRRAGGSRYSGSHPDDRDPQPMDASVERLVADRGWGTELRVHGVFSRWGAIVGPDIAAHATPESYVEGRLVVRADSTAWATQLTLMASSLVRRIDEELGDETVRVVEVLGPRGPSWRKGRLRVRGRGPRDTYG